MAYVVFAEAALTPRMGWHAADSEEADQKGQDAAWRAERRRRNLGSSSLVRTGVGRPSGWAHFIQSSFRVSCMVNSIRVGHDWLPIWYDLRGQRSGC